MQRDTCAWLDQPSRTQQTAGLVTSVLPDTIVPLARGVVYRARQVLLVQQKQLNPKTHAKLAQQVTTVTLQVCQIQQGFAALATGAPLVLKLELRRECGVWIHKGVCAQRATCVPLELALLLPAVQDPTQTEPGNMSAQYAQVASSATVAAQLHPRCVHKASHAQRGVDQALRSHVLSQILVSVHD